MTDDAALAALAAGPRLPLALLERLFDALPDVVFFAKDAEGRYVHANQTLVERLRLTKRAQLLGRRADELFPGGLGERYREQDEAVLRGGPEIVGQLELHLYPNRAPGWRPSPTPAAMPTTARSRASSGAAPASARPPGVPCSRPERGRPRPPCSARRRAQPRNTLSSASQMPISAAAEIRPAQIGSA